MNDELDNRNGPGQPLKFTKEELEKKVNNYFANCDKRKKPYTFAGLAYSLKIDRQTLYNYKEEGHIFFDIIKDARDKIKAYLEERLMEEGKPGQIFIAKNYGYTDKQEITNNINTNGKPLSEADLEEFKARYGLKIDNE